MTWKVAKQLSFVSSGNSNIDNFACSDTTFTISKRKSQYFSRFFEVRILARFLEKFPIKSPHWRDRFFEDFPNPNIDDHDNFSTELSRVFSEKKGPGNHRMDF
jgi:hypothetical protein